MAYADHRRNDAGHVALSAGMLDRRVAIVTGGSSAIGEAIVRRFVREGASVAILDIDLEGAQRVAATLPADATMCVRCDVSSDSDVSAAINAVVDRFGALDILINNAGVPPLIAALDELSEADWDLMMDVQGKGCFLCCKHSVPYMKSRRRGAIVNIASLGGVRGRPFRHTYIASKHAIVGLTKSVALEGIAHNIRANAVAPGPVDTRGDMKDFEAHRAAGGSEISFAVRPEAIAWAALFLACDESINITGVVLPVDAGILAGSLEKGPLKFPTR
jgi:NAD(P)-dependent dehydrogenase (short-subunit alcohol dehydrogenase family)